MVYGNIQYKSDIGMPEVEVEEEQEEGEEEEKGEEEKNNY